MCVYLLVAVYAENKAYAAPDVEKKKSSCSLWGRTPLFLDNFLDNLLKIKEMEAKESNISLILSLGSLPYRHSSSLFSDCPPPPILPFFPQTATLIFPLF
jgi:hypothetical protein